MCKDADRCGLTVNWGEKAKRRKTVGTGRMRYLKDVTVCDTRLPDRACAVPGAEQPRPPQ